MATYYPFIAVLLRAQDQTGKLSDNLPAALFAWLRAGYAGETAEKQCDKSRRQNGNAERIRESESAGKFRQLRAHNGKSVFTLVYGTLASCPTI